MDSTIRIRQLNQPELSGFVSGIFSALIRNSTPSGSIVPSGSGIYDLGSASYPYARIFANQFYVNSGSGINFGNTNFTAYVSGGAAYVNIGGIKISSTGEGILIAGPSGVAGPSGAKGATGATGTSVTGISYNATSHILSFATSDGNTRNFNFSGLSGASGVSVTGFYQSGEYIWPQYDNNKGTGKSIRLLAGPQGPPGGANLFFEKNGTNWMSSGYLFPANAVIDPYYYSTSFPPINFTRGNNYNIDVSGLDTYTLTSQDISTFNAIFTGTTATFSAGDKINYIKTGNNTGYWRFSFFPSGTPTGYYQGNVFTNEAANFNAYGDDYSVNPYRTKLSFTTNYGASGQLRYGFIAYTLTGESISLDTQLTNTGYAWVLGNAFFTDSVGAVGATGPSGAQGIQGNQGDIGPSGADGNDGNGVVSYNQQQIGANAFQVQFIFSDGSTGPWVNLPSGGPSGLQGPSGATGNLLNSWSGEYAGGITYLQYNVVSSSGSTYIYTNSTPSANNPPPNATYWQVLALKGDVGATGASGISDRYSVSFYVQSGFPTGIGTFANGITGLSVNGTSVSGTGARFQNNQLVAFRHSGLIGYSFTPYQSIVFSTNSYTGTYCYATVNSYNAANGTLSFTPSGGTGINNTTVSGGYFLWYNWNNATVNLGANLMSGAQGIQGVQGIQGPPGSAQSMRSWTGYAKSGQSVTFYPTGTNITGGSGIDIFCLTITGDGTQYYGGTSVLLDIDWNYFQTGQSLIVKVLNSGIPYGNDNVPLFYWSGNGVINAGQIKWPNGKYSRPDGGQGYIYTLLRFPDEFGKTACYGTYSNPYF